MNITDKLLGYVGVEYIIWYFRKNTNESIYECLMCDVILHESKLQDHILAEIHRLKYFSKHFPTLSKNLKRHLDTNRLNTDSNKFINRICIAIEAYHGAKSPRKFDKKAVDCEKNRIKAEIYSMRHASEYNGPLFIESIYKLEVDSISDKEHCSNGSIEHIKHDSHFKKEDLIKNYCEDYNQSTFYSCNKILNERLLCDITIKDESILHAKAEAKYKTDSVHEGLVNDKQLETNKNHAELKNDNLVEQFSYKASEKRAIQDNQERFECDTEIQIKGSFERAWKTYRILLKKAVSSIQNKYTSYKINPESHPEYFLEWRKFWLKRKFELSTINIDYRNHNFQTEWINFLQKRLEIFFYIDIEKIKFELCHQMNLTVGNNYFLINSIGTHSTFVTTIFSQAIFQKDLDYLSTKTIDLISKAMGFEKLSKNWSVTLLNEETCALFEVTKFKLQKLISASGFEAIKQSIFANVISCIEIIIAQRSYATVGFETKTSKDLISINNYHRLRNLLSSKGKGFDAIKLEKILLLFNLLQNTVDRK